MSLPLPTPTPRINGALQPVRKSLRIRYDPQQGPTVTQEFESAGDNCNGLAAQFERRGASYDLESSPLRSRLVVTEAQNNFITDSSVERWELMSNQQMLDIREHPRSVAIGQDNLAVVLKAFKNHEAGKSVETDGWGSEMTALFLLLIRGVTHYPVWAWTLRYTANMPNDFLWSKVSPPGTMFTHAQAVNSVPEGRMRNRLMSISEPPSDGQTVWRWLQTGSTETQTAHNRVEVSEEYSLAQWSTFLYT